ncbi:MAG: amino acid adenylation domain-containing protein [Cellulosilyticaceae bacterium]
MLNIDLNSLEEISTEDLVSIKNINAQDIAIIGLAGQFSKADDIDAFWENLREGIDSVDILPKNRQQDIERYLSNYRPQLCGVGYDKGSYIEAIDKFDYSFFKMSPNEANLMDPSQRLFLQTAYHAIEDAGYGGEALFGTQTGVYLGYNADALFAYRNLIADNNPELLAMAVPGNLTSVISGRISYLLDLKGPSLSVDTACSSSLVAIHLACQALRSGDCSMALAGSIRLNMLPINRTQKLGIESSDGITRTFDEKSDGTGNGEGMAVVMLKPLSDAINDKDHIYAVIKGSAMNQDGSSIGITAPNVKAQEEVILSAWKNANVSPESISYIEAHGTGTKLGDPIEIDAITRAFGRYTDKKQFCAIGSVKTNMGHLDNAAGMAGFAKATLALKKGMIPPHLHFETPNSKIDFENAPVYVNTELAEWKCEGYPRRCGISAFGLSGTNCHIILEEAPAIEAMIEENKLCVVTLSAKSPHALNKLVDSYQKFEFQENATLEKIAYTTNIGRGHYKYRLAIVAKNLEDLKSKLALIKEPYHQIQGEDIVFGDGGTVCEREVVMCEVYDLAHYYVEGGTIDWNALYKTNNPGKTRLPLYPFEETRCWVELPETKVVKEISDEIAATTVNQIKQNNVEPLGREEGEYTELEMCLAQIYGEVLGFDSLNIYDDFYDLGGDSIIAMKIVHLIEERIGVETDMSELLECIGVADYCEVLQGKIPERVHGEDVSLEVLDDVAMPIIVQEDICCEASAAQQRMFLMSQNKDLSAAYNITNAISIKGEIHREQIEQAFKALIERHESLRTSFRMVEGEIMQLIHPSVPFKVHYFENQDENVDEMIKDFVKPFNLEEAPLLRVALIQCAPQSYVFVMDCHHIISDGFSVNIINNEFVKLYFGQKLEPMTYQYKDYASAQNELKVSEVYEGHKAYWANQLSGELPILSLATDYDRPTQLDVSGDVYRFKIDQELVERLNQLAHKNSATLYMVLLSAYNVLLSQYSGQEDIIVGTPIAGRNKGDYNNVIGMFVNTLALRNYPEKNKSFEAFLQEVKRTTLDAYKHEAFQFEDLVGMLGIRRDQTRNPLFDTMFALQNLGFEALNLGNIAFNPYPMSTHTSRFDLMFNAIPVVDGIEVGVEYSTVLFKGSTIQNMAKHFIQVLRCITDNETLLLGEIQMLSDEEMNSYKSDACARERDYPLDQTLVDLFSAQVERVPNHIAVQDETSHLTYEALDKYSDAIAYEISASQLQRGDLVAVILPRNTKTIAAIMGILKSGCAYLPIDTDYPQERIAYILEDSGAKMVLTDASSLADLEAYDVELRDVDEMNTGKGYRPQSLCATDTAYVIYTSGSTGNPKGVVVEHRNVVNFIYNLREQYGENVSEEDRLLATTNLCFDVSVCELFLALCFGAALHLKPTQALLDIEGIARAIVSERITYAYLPPALLGDVCMALKGQGQPVDLNKMLVGVEPIQDRVLAGYLALNKDMVIVNGYGPTEATICATFYTYVPEENSQRIVPIGKPLYNTSVYLLDAGLKPVPQGVQGEICVSGAGLARGYLHAEMLTKEKFVENPFCKGERLYRTGDLGRMLPDGNIQFVGRADHQVKIRGYRIEMGEVEAKLKEVAGVKQAVVLAHEDETHTKYLCAYVVSDKEMTEVKLDLKTKLPEYMIPTYFTKLDEIPLTANGKLDRKALPEVIGVGQQKTMYVAAQNETQQKLVGIWQDMLGVHQIGIDDDFFELGGHSLKAARLVYRIKEELDVDIPMTKIFEMTTIRVLAQWIQTQGMSTSESETCFIEAAKEKAYYPVSAAQYRMYVLQQLNHEMTTYNMPSVVEIRGEFELDKVNAVFREIIERHEALRTSFHMVEGEVMQKIHEVETLELTVSYSQQEGEITQQQIQTFIKPFDLTCAPLIRVGVIQTDKNHYTLMMDMHHIVSDGHTVEMITNEFVKLYCKQQLNPVKRQYKDFSEWQLKQFEEGILEKEKNYWGKVFEEEVPTLTLPYDYTRPSVQSFEGDQVDFTINQMLLEKLELVANETGTTLYMVLLATYQMLLSKYSGQEDLVVGTPVTGRTTAQMEEIAGMFVNTLALRQRMGGEMTYRELLMAVKETVLDAMAHQSVPFDQVVDRVEKYRDASHNPLFDTMLVFQNYDMQETTGMGVIFSPRQIKANTAKVDLALNAVRKADSIACALEYCTKLFKERTVYQIARHYLALLEQIAENAQKQIKDYQMMSSEEIHLLNEWNHTTHQAGEESVIGQIERQAVSNPVAPAISCKGQTLSFEMLNAKANTIADRLINEGIQKQDIVGIMMENSVEMVIALLGILKAGAAFMPIHPTMNLDRVLFMIEDSGMKILLKDVGNTVEACQTIIVPRQEEIDNTYENKNRVTCSQDLAYVIYTSGTTGKPKGVMISQNSFANIVQWHAKDYGFSTKRCAMQTLGSAFDGFILTFFSALTSGAHMVLPATGENTDMKRLSDLIHTYGVDHITMVPVLLEEFLEAISEETAKQIKSVTVGGDALTSRIIELGEIKNPQMEIVNEYGPTECTIIATRKRSPNKDYVTIGSPIANNQIYILDKYQNLVPQGVNGEIYIGGAGLAKGYLNRPELTREKFVENPFEPGSKMYRTGDIGKWDENGEIVFGGRIDYQVKIRGYRIELGEIETHLLQIPGISQGVVVDKVDEAGTRYLCAYVVCEEALTTTQIKEKLKEMLPDYMIPSYFVKLDHMPVNTNGKIDRKALPEVEGMIDTGSVYVPAQNATEEKLVAIWQSILGIQKIGIEDQFFDLGGHSLKAAKLIAQIQSTFSVEITLKDVFANTTIKLQADLIQQAKTCGYTAIEKAPIMPYYPLSTAQERLYVFNQIDGGVAYNLPSVLKITGKIDTVRFEHVLEELVERHSQLRVSFHLIDGQPMQKIHEKVQIDFDQVTCEKDQVETYIQSFVKPFDFEKPSLIRFLLIHTQEDTHYFVYDMHHIVADGVTAMLLAKEFMACYGNQTLDVVETHYEDYVLWQRENVQEAKNQEAYWMETLSGNITPLDLPTDFVRPAVQDYKGANISYELDLELVQKIKNAATTQGVTPYMLCLAAYNILLYKYTGQDDILVGTPVAGRSRVEFENIAGMFVNTVVLRNYPVGTKCVAEFIQEVKGNTLSAFDHQAYQFETLLQKLNLKRDVSRSPLFDTMFAYQNMGMPGQDVEGLHFEQYPLESHVSKFDLTFTMIEAEQMIGLNVEYATSLYEGATIERMIGHYVSLLEAITCHSDQSIDDYTIITKEEEELILDVFNGTDITYSHDKTLHELFEEQVERTPERRAVGFGDQALTYRELNERANSLAHILQEKGVKPEGIVGLMAERSLEMMVAILAILKAGGAYMPMGPTYPEDRMRYMLEETGAKVVLAQERFMSRVPHDEVINLDEAHIYGGNTNNLGKTSDKNNLAYVMYTSGSTGRPKGVMIEHTSAVNQMEWRQRKYPLGKDDIIMQKTPFTFDISVSEIFWWMLAGAGIYFLEPDGEKDPKTILETIQREKITIIHFVPSMMSLFLDYYEIHQEEYDLSSLKRLMSGGEALTVAQTEKFNKLLYSKYGITMHNLYGPTEATIEVSYYDCPTTEKVDNILIGKPSSNARLYVLDKQERLQPIGVVGELYIAGVGVARGYLKREDLTAEKFMKDPYHKVYRMYRSGDLAKCLPNGEIEYLGRMDNQVKISGLRIELGEIEERMTEHNQIGESAVTVREDADGNKYLCGYYTGEQELSVDELRQHITQKLPDYMVPAYFMKMDKMPLSANGKLDRKALPEVEGHIETGIAYVAPESEIEQLVASIWENILKVEQVGVLDNYRYLGGDSIKAIKVVVKLADAGYCVNVRDVIESSNIRELSTKVKKAVRSYNQMALEGYMDMIPVQICFFEFDYKDMHIWNMPTMFYMKNGFDEQMLQPAFDAIVKHHDALRIVFQNEEGNRKQYIRGIDSQLFDLEVHDFRALEDPTDAIEKSADRIQASISLEEGPLVKLGLFKTKGCDYLLFVVHHLVIDFTSLQVIQEDLLTAYRQLLAGETIKLPQKTASFKDWSESIYRFARSEDILDEIGYWEAIDKAEVLPLPKDHHHVNRQVNQQTHMSIELSEEDTNAFVTHGMDTYGATVNELLLTGLAGAFKEWCGQDTIRMRLAGNGKNWCYDDLDISRTVGWFSISYPMVIDASAGRYEENINQTMSIIRNIPKNGCGYDVLRYITLPERQDEMKFNCEPEMFFNYLGVVEDEEEGTKLGDFGVSDMPVGRTYGDQSDTVYNFDFSAAIYRGRLNVSVTYVQTEYDEATVQNLLEIFMNQLRGIKMHTQRGE